MKMRKLQLLLAGAFIACGSLFAQTPESEWKPQVEKLKTTIQSNPEQAEDDAKQLTKGKNKKNEQLLIAIGYAYLDAQKYEEAENYADMARKANRKSAYASILLGDIAMAQKDPGTASQKYEEATLFDPKCVEAYMKFADMYRGSNNDLVIEKLQQLKQLEPNNVAVDRKLAEVYFSKNDFKKAIECYASFANKPEATQDDRVRYAFALFLDHDFEKSLEIVNAGLQKDPKNPVFNRLAMYNNTDLKRFEEALKAADIFFNESEKAEYSSLDYKYYGFLLEALKRYEECAQQFEKAIELDSTQTALYQNISTAYQQVDNYKKAIDAYQKYCNSLEQKTPDLQFQLGRLYYGAGTQSDTLTTTPEERKQSLLRADSIFSEIAKIAPDSHLGNFWRARTNSALDPETTEGLAKPFYEEVAKLVESKNDPARYKSVLIECYSYLGFYYLVAEKVAESKEYWNKILAIDPENATAKRALEGLK